MKHVNIYLYTTFRGVRRQNGVIGYVLECNGGTLSDFKEIRDVTCHFAEISVLGDALGRLIEDVDLDIYTESQYVYKGIIEWMYEWDKASWKNKKGDEVANMMEWQLVFEYLSRMNHVVHHEEEHEYRNWLKSEVNRRKK